MFYFCPSSRLANFNNNVMQRYRGCAFAAICAVCFALAFFTSRASAQRVVSLVPSATFTAVQFGADANIVGRTSYCPEPGKGVRSVIVGDAMTVSVEAVVALSPDVVLASSFTPAPVVDKLKSLGIAVELLRTPKDFDEICSQALYIGRVTGHLHQADELVARVRKEVESIASHVASKKGSGKFTFYVQIGAKPLWGATPDYYIDAMLAMLGGVNILSVGEGACSRESVLNRAPHLVVVSSLGGLGPEEAAAWRRLSAAKVVVVDEDALCCPTPLFFRRALKSIADAL